MAYVIKARLQARFGALEAIVLRDVELKSMATVSVQAQLTTEQLLEAIGQLDAVSLESVTQKALQLQAQNNAQDRFQREAELLEIIFHKKPLVFRRRFDHLNKKRRAFKLTPEEHQELLRLIEEAQAFDVRYVEALVELAQVRQMPLPELMRQLGITAQQNGCSGAPSTATTGISTCTRLL